MTAEIEALTARLLVAGARRARSAPSSGPDRREVRNHGNAVMGLRNPFAVDPARDATVDEDRHVHVDVDLGALYEGPPGLVHGGVSALILDQLLGEAAAVGGGPGMTGRLTAALPPADPARAARASRRWLDVHATAASRSSRARSATPTVNVTVEAEGLFILPEVGDRPPRVEGPADSAFE